MTKGFITIATGKEEYYRLAQNLLRSYRCFSKMPLPFAILADRENEYTAGFDDVILFPDGAANSYLDKLRLAEFAPYDTTIFIDADCLAYGDLNVLFEYFKDADDFSCFGRVLPLDDKTGWFEYENLGELQGQVDCVVGLHGGIYFMRKGIVSSKVFEDAKAYIPDYPKFKFKGKFDTPGDEPLVALSMATNGVRPIPFVKGAIFCYWEAPDAVYANIAKGIAECPRDGKKILLLHWGTRFTRTLAYKGQVELLAILETPTEDTDKRIAKCVSRYERLMTQEKIRNFIIRVKNKILRTFGIKK